MLKYGAASARWYLGTRVRRSGWGQTLGEATWEGEQYLFQPQTDWDHCRVCRIRPLAGTGPAGNLAAEGRREISKRVKTTSYTLGGSAVGPGARTFEEKTGKSKQWYRSCWRCVGKLRPAPGRLALATRLRGLPCQHWRPFPTMSGWAPDCLGCGQEKGHGHLRLLSNCILLSCPGGPQAERMRDPFTPKHWQT